MNDYGCAKMSIAEVVESARACGMSYGQYVAKYRSHEDSIRPKPKNNVINMKDLGGEFSSSGWRINKNELKSLYQSGLSIKELANYFDVTPAAISKCITRCGFTRSSDIRNFLN